MDTTGSGLAESVVRGTVAAGLRLVREGPAAPDAGRGIEVRSDEALAAVVWPVLVHEPGECVVVVLLDTKMRTLCSPIVVGRGGLSGCTISPMQVFRAAVLAGAVFVAVAHNHPSGDPTPSPDDRYVTRELAAAGRVLEIGLADHMIVGTGPEAVAGGVGRFVSMRAEGVL